jgi:CRISPR-associated helicase Cas3
LAGLCHDIYKAHPDWQAYVRSSGAIRKGPAHAAAGAFLFSWLAYRWLESNNLWNRYRLFWLRMTRDIADHHGRLDPLVARTNPSWLQKFEWDRLDLAGITRFLWEELPDFAGEPFLPPSVTDWIHKANRTLEKMRLEELDPEMHGESPLQQMCSLQKWRQATTALVSADRFSIHSVPEGYWMSDEVESSARVLGSFLATLDRGQMGQLRSKVQNEALENYRKSGCPNFITIGLPTGYGKTLLALRLALEMVRNESYRKVIYVAPYLSILEQASQDMQRTYGVAPLEHHSLAVLPEETSSEVEEKGSATSSTSLMMESWAHPLICTSFHQFSKALFPERAQHVLRRAWLDNSIVIIDEPQIFRAEGWNLLLTGLEAAAEMHRMKVMFLSATMPPMRYGLQRQPAELCPDVKVVLNRYYLAWSEEPIDQHQLASLLAERPERSLAAILNTVRDAQLVYSALKAIETSTEELRLLHGGMVPLHKKARIGEIRHLLSKTRRRITVVATQIIEAGVDVSFRFLFRANAILPSIVQAAGRVNRHGEDETGTVLVRPFLRDGETDTRVFIYKQNMLRKLTDELLSGNETQRWPEAELRQLLITYYERMFQHNTYEACLQDIANACAGNWPALGSFEPFENEAFRLPVFVPWDVPKEMRRWVPEHYAQLLRRFDVKNAQEIYERYLDREWLRNLSPEERKAFMILFHYHVINLPGKMAIRSVSRDEYLERCIPCLHGARGYSTETGWLGDDDPESQFF